MVPPCGTPFVVFGGPSPAPAAAHRAPYDTHHLVDIRLTLAGRDGVGQAAIDVVLEDEQRDPVRRRDERLDLLQDVEAVRLLVDEPGDPARLALDPPQAVDEERPVLAVAVPEVVVGARGAIGLRHTAHEYRMDR